MKWGFFTPIHIATLLAAAAMNLGLYYFLKHKSVKVQTLVMLPFSLLGVGAIIFNLLKWGSPLEYLPLHLCSINAMLLPVVLLTRSKTLGNLLLVWCLGALAALVLNFEMQNVELLGAPFFWYYFPHVFEFGLPLMFIKLGLVKMDAKYIPTTLALTMLIYTGVHLCNVSINSFCRLHEVMNNSGVIIQVNYMFSVNPTNPLVALFYKFVPHPYWYMYLVLPIVAGYLAAIYAPQLFAIHRRKARVFPFSKRIAH